MLLLIDARRSLLVGVTYALADVLGPPTDDDDAEAVEAPNDERLAEVYLVEAFGTCADELDVLRDVTAEDGAVAVLPLKELTRERPRLDCIIS